MERIVESGNAQRALKRVEQNKGSPGIDGMKVEELRPYLRQNWLRLKQELLSGTYQPMAVRVQEIPKSNGGTRRLGIPTALDRFVQQLILQVLQPQFDPTFSEGSFGFRPKRSAHDAVRVAQKYIQSGKNWVVDVDLEKFFDRVNHDVLMSRLERRIVDRRLLGLIRRYLRAGAMVNGVVRQEGEGTPQGGPLSPLLANVLLDEVDKELEKRNLNFVRYADDCNVYVGSERAAQRTMTTLKHLYGRLRLRVNESKSAVDRPWNRKFLGYSFFTQDGTVKRRVAPQAEAKMKERVREITGRARGRSMKQVARELAEYLPGWKAYFKLEERRSTFTSLDSWIRRRLRALQLKLWKTDANALRELRKLKRLSEQDVRKVSNNRRRYWSTATGLINAALVNAHFDALGVPRLAT